MHTSSLTYDIITKANKFNIKEDILLKCNEEDTDIVIVPEGIRKISALAFPETIDSLCLPRSLTEIKPDINARKIYIYGATKINFSIISTKEVLEEVTIKNVDDDENIINTLEDIIEKAYYFSKLKRIVLKGKLINEEYQEKLESLKEKFQKYSRIKLIIATEFEIEEGVLKAYNGENTNVIIPEGVEKIGSFAFRDCNLSNVILPESLKSIMDNAFDNNNLEKVVIPSNVNYIFPNAFSNNPNLKTLEIKSDIRFDISNIEHLILNSKNFDNDDYGFVLNINRENLKNLKTLTIMNNRIDYYKLKEIVEKLQVSNLKVVLRNNEKQANYYNFVNGKLNSVTINICKYEFTYIEALNECYKLYINNSNGNEVKKFIDFIKLWYFNKPKELGMIIIKGENISLLEKLELNKVLKKMMFYSYEPEKIEEQEETTLINNSIEDEEISKLLNEITSMLETYISTEDKNKILLQIANIINKYKQDLEKIKPKLFNESLNFGEEILTPETLRMNLIMELNRILTRLKTNDIYLKLRKNIDELESLLNIKKIETPNIIDTLEDKVKYIIKYNLYEKYNFIKELQEIFNEIKKQISNHIVTFDNNIKLINDIPIDIQFKEKVNTLYEKVKRIINIEEVFNNKNSELSQDINTIRTIISNFSVEHQEVYNEKLDNIVNKFYQELISGEREDLNETILEIRKELSPLLEELSKKSNTYTMYKELIDELNGEKNNRVSTIEILINEITTLRDNNKLDEITKSEINNKLESLINSWKRKLINNYEPKEEHDPLEEIFQINSLLYIPKLKTNNVCIEIEIEITKDLLTLKNEILKFIQQNKDYEKMTKVIKNLKI